MKWNYRVMDFGDHFALHEVFYSEGGGISWTESPIYFACGEDEGVDGIIGSLEMALADAKHRSPIKIRDGAVVTEQPPEPDSSQ